MMMRFSEPHKNHFVFRQSTVNKIYLFSCRKIQRKNGNFYCECKKSILYKESFDRCWEF
jgi:hypothetical protein